MAVIWNEMSVEIQIFANVLNLTVMNNFQLLEIVGRDSDVQPQVSYNLNKLT